MASDKLFGYFAGLDHLSLEPLLVPIHHIEISLDIACSSYSRMQQKSEILVK